VKDGAPIAAVDLTECCWTCGGNRQEVVTRTGVDCAKLALCRPVLLKPGGGADALALPPPPWCGSSGGGALFRPIGDGVVQGRAGRAPPRHDEIDFEMEAA